MSIRWKKKPVYRIGDFFLLALFRAFNFIGRALSFALIFESQLYNVRCAGDCSSLPAIKTAKKKMAKQIRWHGNRQYRIFNTNFTPLHIFTVESERSKLQMEKNGNRRKRTRSYDDMFFIH